MIVNKKTGVAIFILLILVAIGTFYSTDRKIENHEDSYALSDDAQQTTALRVTTLQGEDLTRIDAWLAQQNETGLKSASIP